MQQLEWIAPCHFGLEAVLKREVKTLGYEVSQVEDGKVYFYGDRKAACRTNLFLRTAERVLLKIARFSATTFEELFEKTKEIAWEEYIPEHAKFWVSKATAVKSKLFSTSDIQSIVKKAIVERLKKKYRISWFPEDGEAIPIRVVILKDEVLLALDTSGEALHRRGYRKQTTKAPISETLAAAIILLTPWKKDRILVDPFCGSGTIPIEAAWIAQNRAPGLQRSFVAEQWTAFLKKQDWDEVRQEARAQLQPDQKMEIQGYDIDGRAIQIAHQNAINAGVDTCIHLQQRAVSELRHRKKYGFLITNPPYGERLGEKETLPKLYQELGTAYRRLESWSAYIISGNTEIEKWMGCKANKNRKIYNAMLKTYLYQFLGPKPPKKGNL